MIRRVSLVALALIAALAGASAPVCAREAIVGVNQSIEGDSNLYNGPTGNVPDGSYRISPTIRVREQNDELNYDFYYGPSYQAYFTTDDVNGWNQDYVGRLMWRFSPRDQITLKSRAYLNRAVTTITDGTIADPGTGEQGLGDVGRYLVSLDWSHGFTERIRGNIGGRYEQWTFTNTRNTPNISGAGELGTTYVVLPRWMVGVRLDGTYRRFEASGGRAPLTSVVAAANVVTNYEITPSIDFLGSIGPSYVRQRQDEPGAREVNQFRAGVTPTGDAIAAVFANCFPNSQGQLLLEQCGASAGETANNVGAALFDTVPRGFLPGTQTTEIESDYATFFMVARFTKNWRRGSASIGYSRSQDASGGVASTTVADIASLDGKYLFNRRTKIGFYARFVNRQTDATESRGTPLAIVSSEVSDAPFSRLLAEAGPLVLIEGRNETDRMEVLVSADAAYSLTKSLQIRGQFVYVDSFTDYKFTSADGSVFEPSTSRFTRFLGRIVLRYEFDPIRF